MSNTDMLTKADILKHLKTENLDVSVFKSVTSTNKILKEMAVKNAREGTVIVALSQTDGHGRYDRKFYSDFGGIYLSVLLRPKLLNFDATLLTSAVAVAVSNAIDEVAKRSTKIKWVNDILLDNKKVCGILCEGGFCGDDSFFVVGIGINARPTKNGLDNQIKDIATTLFNTYSTDILATLCARVIDNLFYEYNHLQNREFLTTYRQKSAVLGKEITVLSMGENIGTAIAVEIDDECRLLVEFENGEKKKLISDEISIKIAN